MTLSSRRKRRTTRWSTLASRGISLALAGGATFLAWGIWANAKSPDSVDTEFAPATQAAANSPDVVATETAASSGDMAPTASVSPLERLKQRSPEERVRNVFGTRTKSVRSADPVADARRTLPLPDDLRHRRAPDSTATTGGHVQEPVADMPLDGALRARNESPLAEFEPVVAGGTPTRPTVSVASQPESTTSDEAKVEPNTPKSPPVVTEFSPEEGTIPAEPAVARPTHDEESVDWDKLAALEEPMPISSGKSTVHQTKVQSEPEQFADLRDRRPVERVAGTTIESPEPAAAEQVTPENAEVAEVDQSLAVLDSLPPEPSEPRSEPAHLEPIPAAPLAPQSVSARRLAALRQTEAALTAQSGTMDREPTRDPRELKKVNTIHPFTDYEPDLDIVKSDRCQNLCPRPGKDCPDCKPGSPDEMKTCPDCPEEVALNSTEFNQTFTQRSFPGIDYRWEAANVWHYPLYFEDPELERYGHARPFYIQPFYSAARFSGQFLLFPYRASLLPPWKHDYELGMYRPGRCVPFRYEVLPWNRKAAAWQAGVVTGAYFLFAPTP